MERGRVSVGGSGGGRGGKVALGGIGGVVVLVVALLLGGDPGELLSQLGGVDGSSQGGSGEAGTLEGCETEEDANSKVDCRIGFTVSSLDTVWQSQLAAQTGVAYVRPAVNIFTDSTFTGCGSATSAVGPFYCPANQTIYIDTSFYDTLERQLGAGGDFARYYVLAHEYGHHIQTITGISQQIRSAQQQNPSRRNQLQVLMELQADCYAGVWAGKNSDLIEPGDFEEGMEAAAAIGDDAISERMGGRASPESFTHGTSEQRMEALRLGMRSGDDTTCDRYFAPESF